jgi:hypothetical protein
MSSCKAALFIAIPNPIVIAMTQNYIAAEVYRNTDFERERERCERLIVEVLKATAELMAAREAMARIAGELAAYQARPWWRRFGG